MLLLLGACGSSATTPAGTPAHDAADAKLDSGADGSSDTEATELLEDVDLPDLLTADADDVEIAEDLNTSEGPADIAQCATLTDCEPKALSDCEAIACVKGNCTVVTKPDLCCSDSVCDDQDGCTSDHCDLDSHVCGHAPVPDCCPGKKLIGQYDFEAATWSDFAATAPPSNGTVQWQASTTRAHAGKTSLYFGNPCHNYDTSSAVANGCKAAKAAPVSTTLTSKDFALPGGIGAQLDFWLWLDTEPPYADSVPVGLCMPACGPSDTCVLVSGSPQCIPEKDVLTLSVQVGGQTMPLFYSTQIGKNTKGAWQHIAVDLSSYAGKTVALRWSFATLTGLKNGYEGIYLDDIRLQTACQGNASAACSADVPCSNDGQACTLESCTPFANAIDQGWCYHDKAPGCCTQNADCGDANDCTIDTCVANACTFEPDVSKPACCKPEVLLFDDFDTPGLEGWTPSGANSTSIVWRSEAGGGPAKTSDLCFGNAACDGYDDPNLPFGAGPKGALCSKVAKLKSGTVFNLLSFDLLLDTEWSDVLPASYKNPLAPGNPKIDLFSVDLYFDAALHPAWSSDAIYGTTAGKWLPVTIPLDAWQGKSVQVCLRFDAGDAQANTKKGLHIDNFVLKVACAKKACYWDAECTALSCGACSAPSCSVSGCACVKTPGCS